MNVVGLAGAAAGEVLRALVQDAAVLAVVVRPVGNPEFPSPQPNFNQSRP